MKRALSFLCVVCLLVGLTACGNTPENSEGSTPESSTTTTTVGTDNGTSATDGTTADTADTTVGSGTGEDTTTASTSGAGSVTTTPTTDTGKPTAGQSSTAGSSADKTTKTTSTTKATTKPGFSVTKPKPSVTEGEMLDLALNVYQDLLDNWWTGNAKTGHFIPTNGGKPSETMGIVWEHAMALLALDTLYQATGMTEIHNRIIAEWEYIKKITPSHDYFVKPAYGHNQWQDDAGWAAMFYMVAYKHTGDKYALDITGELIRNCYDYWEDGDLATNGLFYYPSFEPDTRNRFNSMHAVSLLTAAFDYLEYRDDPQLEKDTMAIYNWLEKNMLRDGEFSYVNSLKQTKTGFCDDMLYWFNYNQQRAEFSEYTGPEGAATPNTMKEGQSYVFLGGTMGMAGVHVQLYNRTGEKKYLERAQRTLRAVNDNKYLIQNGVYVNAGDAWTNASFMYSWVTRVLTLPGLQKKDVKILKDTANSIYNHSRTNDGYYSGSWSGPAEDADTPWGRMGWSHDTIMCSATSIHMVFAAALAESMGLG